MNDMFDDVTDLEIINPEETAVCEVMHPTAMLYMWDQAPNESVAEFTVFRNYLYLGSARSFKALSVTSGHTPIALQGMGTRNNWEARAAAYDRHMHDLQSRVHEITVSNAFTETEGILVESLRHEIGAILMAQRQEVESGESPSINARTSRARRLSMTLADLSKYMSEINSAKDDVRRPVNIQFDLKTTEEVREMAAAEKDGE